MHYSGYSTALNVSILSTGVTVGLPADGPYPGVYCSVYIANTSVLAAITSPATGLAMLNPFLVNAEGYYAFDGTDLRYTHVFSTTLPASTTPHEVVVPSFALASLPTPASAGRLARLTNSDLSLWMDSGSQWFSLAAPFNVKAFGAVGDGVADDTAAILAATTAAVAAGQPVSFPAGTFLTALTTFAAATRTVWRGAGRGLTTIKVKGTTGTAIAATWMHLTSEWYGELSHMTIDGNGGAGPLVSMNGATLFVMRDLALTNVTGTALKLVSFYDSHFENVYVETCGDSAHPCVVCDTNATGSDGFNNNQFYNLHIEPGNRDAIHLDLIGNATNLLDENKFFGLKTHGDSSTCNPNRPLVRIGAYSKNNRFPGYLGAFGKGTSQVEINGDGNQFDGPVLGLGASAPQCAFDLIGNYNRVTNALPKNTTYSVTYFRNSGNENLVLHPRLGAGGPVVYVDTGQFHIEYRDPTTTYYYVYDTQGQKFTTGLYLGFFGATPVTQQASGANLTNNVTAGGVSDTIANYTDLVTYANDAGAIRNDIYQLARKVKQLNDALRTLGLFN